VNRWQAVEESSSAAGDRRRYREREFVDDVGGEQRLGDRDAPWTPMSPPGWCLRSRTNSTSPPSTTVELAHSWSSGVDVATYFSTPLMNVANGSIWLLGQNCAHSL
jgi:hypothetical protein